MGSNLLKPYENNVYSPTDMNQSEVVEESERKVNDIVFYNHREAELILRRNGLMESLLQILSTSDKFHESLVYTLSINNWEIGKNLFNHAYYQIDAYRDRIALQIEVIDKLSGRGMDIVHRDLFRLMALHSFKLIDAAVLVLRIKKSGEVNYHRIVAEIKALGKAIPVPLLLFGI